MKRSFTTILSLTLLLYALLPAGMSGAVNVGLNDVINALETPFKVDVDTAPGGIEAVHDFEADFFQQSHMASLDRIQRGTGQVRVMFDRQRTNRVPVVLFRWEYVEPTDQEIVSNGRTLWVYLPENNQVIESDIEFVSQSRATDPVTFLSGLGNLSRDFYISWANPNYDVEGNYVLELRPNKPNQMITRLLLVVDKDAILEYRDVKPMLRGETGDIFPLLSSTVYDPSGNSTTIEFSDVRVNIGLSEADFDFRIPPDVDVLRPTGEDMGF